MDRIWKKFCHSVVGRKIARIFANWVLIALGLLCVWEPHQIWEMARQFSFCLIPLLLHNGIENFMESQYISYISDLFIISVYRLDCIFIPVQRKKWQCNIAGMFVEAKYQLLAMLLNFRIVIFIRLNRLHFFIPFFYRQWKVWKTF